MYVSHDELVWMLRQINGQRIDQQKLIRKFVNHGIYSLLPYFSGIGTIFAGSSDKPAVVKKLVRALAAKTNQQIDLPDDNFSEISFQELEEKLLPVIIQSLENGKRTGMVPGARVMVKLDRETACVKPGSEGFVVDTLPGAVKVRFYSTAGRYAVDLFSADVPAEDLQLLTVDQLLARHQNYSGVAQYFFRDTLLRVMKSAIDSGAYSFAARLALDFLVEQGFAKVTGDVYFSVPEPIFSVLAPQLDAAYRDQSLFSSPDLFSPPAERKPHVLRLELTTGCDYNRCTFCTEYSEMTPVSKTFDQFREHTDRVIETIGLEKTRIRRLFFGSGNCLGVDTELLLEVLNYASGIFSPQRISLYGRTASILEKSVDQLKKLKDAGLGLVYWGLESGSDEVLDFIGKECSRNDMIAASQMLAEAGIEVSGTIMPGAGGLKFSKAHIAGTLELLHNIDINFLTLLSINPAENSLYAKKIEAEPDNRPLTDQEVMAQIYALLEGLEPTGLQIGMFTEEVEKLSSNRMRFNSQFTEASKAALLRGFWQ